MSARLQPLARHDLQALPHAAAGSAGNERAPAAFSPTIPSPLAEAANSRRTLQPLASRRMSWVLLRTTIALHVQARNFRFLLLPAQDRILSTAPDTEGMLGDLLQGASCSTARAHLPLEGGDWSRYRSADSLQQLGWELALREDPLPRYTAAEDHRVFRLAGWPAHVRLDRTDQRLAALFTRSEATIYQGCRLVDVPRARVVAFLSACEASGLQVACSDRGRIAHDWPQVPLVSGLELRRVRGHLRLVGAAGAA